MKRVLMFAVAVVLLLVAVACTGKAHMPEVGDMKVGDHIKVCVEDDVALLVRDEEHCDGEMEEGVITAIRGNRAVLDMDGSMKVREVSTVRYKEMKGQ